MIKRDMSDLQWLSMIMLGRVPEFGCLFHQPLHSWWTQHTHTLQLS